MVAQLIESSPVEPLVVGVHLFPGDTWFREIRVVSTTSQQPVDLSAWVFEAKLGDGVGTVDASRAAEGILSVTFDPSVTASAKRGTQLTIAGTLGGGRRTFVVGRVGAEVGSSIPVGLVQRKRVVQTDVDISVYAAPRGDKGQDGAAISQALVEQVQADRSAAGTSAFNAGASAAAAQSSEEEAQRAESVAVSSAEQARVFAGGTVALQDAAVVELVKGETATRQALLGAVGAAVAPANKRALLASTRPATVIALGTSITNQGSFNTSGGGNQFQNGTDDVGYLSHAIVRLNHSLRVLRNAGVSGNNSAQMLARLQADVLDYAPGWVIVETGAPNDIGVGMTLAQSIANHKAIYDAIEATGARVVATTPMPYGLNDASNSTGRRQFISGLRRWIVKYAQERGHVLADFYPALVREDGTGLWRGTGWSDGTNATQSDGIHPKPPAAALAGKILADALRPHIADRKSLWLPGGNVDAWNLLANGMMFGTGGTTKPAGVTGDLATSWAAYGAAGSGGAGTLSKVARADGVNGEWQQYTATAGNTDGFNFQQQNQAGLGSAWNVGDVVVAAVEVETDADWTGGVQMGLLLSAPGSSSAVQDLRHAGSNTGWAPGASSGVLAAKMTVGTGATRLQVQTSVRMATGTVRFGRAGLWNITQMVAAGIIDTEFLTTPTV